MISRLEIQFPLYRDIVQPFKRGVLEVSHGISQLLQASHTTEESTCKLAFQLAEFPRFKGKVLCKSVDVAVKMASELQERELLIAERSKKGKCCAWQS